MWMLELNKKQYLLVCTICHQEVLLSNFLLPHIDKNGYSLCTLDVPSSTSYLWVTTIMTQSGTLRCYLLFQNMRNGLFFCLLVSKTGFCVLLATNWFNKLKLIITSASAPVTSDNLSRNTNRCATIQDPIKYQWLQEIYDEQEFSWIMITKTLELTARFH